MKEAIVGVRGMEILDSRGNPTVRVFVELNDGTQAPAKMRPLNCGTVTKTVTWVKVFSKLLTT